MRAFLDLNLEALSRRDPRLAAAIARCEPAMDLGRAEARNGETVPIVYAGGISTALHSLFDPSREARRLHDALLHEASGNPGYLLFEGLGGGYQIRPFLASPRPLHALVVEHDAAHLRALLSIIDLSSVLGDPRVCLLVGPAEGEVSAHIRSTYLPAVMGGFLSVPLRSRVRLLSTFFESVSRGARVGIEETSQDYSVQATFGRLWTRNIITNLAAFPNGRMQPEIGEALVTAAGPSLETQLDLLSKMRRGRYLIATDTSLPALLSAGQVPEAVLTIDCQELSHHHYLQGIPESTQLFYELGAPPAVVRLTENRSATAGGHPLSLLAASQVGPMPLIDTTGGNVTHAAVSLAIVLGASRVHLFGADFSYPGGKPYARGTYLHPYFGARQLRTRPFEGGFTELMLRNPTLRREESEAGLRYTTETLVAYRDRLNALIGAAPVPVVSVPGPGLAVALPRLRPSEIGPSAGSDHGRVSAQSPDQARRSVRRFLAIYREKIARLPTDLPALFVGGQDRGDSPERAAELFATLYPVMARLRREKGSSAIEPELLLEEAKELVLSIVDHALGQSGDTMDRR